MLARQASMRLSYCSVFGYLGVKESQKVVSKAFSPTKFVLLSIPCFPVEGNT